MTHGILNDTKKVLGVSDSDTSFDVDILMHINTTFATLQSLGVGPTEGFYIEGHGDEWEDYLPLPANNAFNMIRSYMYLKVRMLFDPPQTAFLMSAMQKQIEEYEWRISQQREWGLNPVDPALESEEEDE